MNVCTLLWYAGIDTDRNGTCGGPCENCGDTHSVATPSSVFALLYEAVLGGRVLRGAKFATALLLPPTADVCGTDGCPCGCALEGEVEWLGCEGGVACSMEVDAPRGVLPALFVTLCCGWLPLLCVLAVDDEGSCVDMLAVPEFEIRAGGGGGAVTFQCCSLGVLAPDMLSMNAVTGAEPRLSTGGAG